MASLKRISILFPILILAGCAGQGVSNPGMHLPEIRSDEARIFVKRQTGYVGSAALIEVKHNGSLISKLGEGESVSILGTIGDNTVSVNFTGLASIGVNSPVKIIKLSEAEKVFLAITLQQELFSGKLRLYEVDEKDFMQQ